MTTPVPFLVVRSGGRPIGLDVREVLQVVEGRPAAPVPSRAPALRGLAPVGGALLPVLHLGALLAGGRPPRGVGEALVVIRIGGRRVALEVDAADAVRRETVLPRADDALPWARGIASVGDGYVPLLDLDVLARRLAGEEAA